MVWRIQRLWRNVNVLAMEALVGRTTLQGVVSFARKREWLRIAACVNSMLRQLRYPSEIHQRSQNERTCGSPGCVSSGYQQRKSERMLNEAITSKEMHDMASL